MKKIDIIDLIIAANRIEEENLTAPFYSFSLAFVDSAGTHIIRYTDSFEESKSAVIHQLKKILKYPQNYIDVNVFITTVEPPENDRTFVLNKEYYGRLISEKVKKDYGDHLISQECEGTFEVKDGKVQNINLSGIALIPARRG